jgi:hypothetical protein
VREKRDEGHSPGNFHGFAIFQVHCLPQQETKIPDGILIIADIFLSG